MYLLSITFPLIGSLIAGFFGRYLGQRGAPLIATASIILSCLCGLIPFYEVGLSGSPCTLELFTFIDSDIFFASWGFLFDSLTVVMVFVVSFVSSLVHIFSLDYLAGDPHRPRFFSYLSLFTFFMLILVTANNFVVMVVGWEGVGFCSYFLINFWFTRIQANKSAIKAVICNRVGDFFLLLGIIGILIYFGSTDYNVVFASIEHFATYKDFGINGDDSLYWLGSDYKYTTENGISKETFFALLLFGGCVGKSAQMGLHPWLPDAMEGPTPVSSLLHAATMVTAGVFLVVRSSALFESSAMALLVVSIMGGFTAFFSAAIAMGQYDIKRIIAYSTCSQLGFMFLTCGVSAYYATMYTLTNHAFFKALLFMCAGCVIHAIAEYQDIRRMGMLINLIPFTALFMLIGSMSIVGIPYMSGFFAKEAVLATTFANYSFQGHFSYVIAVIAAIGTSFYSFKILHRVFLRKQNKNVTRSSMSHIHEPTIYMMTPLVILSFGSVTSGYFLKDMFIGEGSDFWGNSIYGLPQHLVFFEAEYIPSYEKLLPVLCSFYAISQYLTVYYSSYSSNVLVNSPSSLSIFLRFNFFANKRWYFDAIYNDTLNKALFMFGYNYSFKTLDRGVVEIFGPYGLTLLVGTLSREISRLQSGFIYHYAFVMLIGVTFYLTFIELDFFVTSLFYSKLYIFLFGGILLMLSNSFLRFK